MSFIIGSGITITPDPGFAPINISSPEISGTPEFEETLTTTLGMFQGLPYPTFQIQWQRGNISIAGATSFNYTTVSEDIGKELKTQITATNSLGNVQVTSAPTVAILPKLPGQPGTPSVSIPGAPPGINFSYKQIAINWSGPSVTGGQINNYEILNNLDQVVANVSGNVTQTTLTLSISDIDTFFTYRVRAINDAGAGPLSSPSISLRSAPSPGTILGSGVGRYVGNGLVIRLAVNSTFPNVVHFIANNLIPSSFTTGYFLADLTTFQQYRTSSGGLLSGGGGPFWTSNSCGTVLDPPSRITMSNTGAAACITENTIGRQGIGWAGLV